MAGLRVRGLNKAFGGNRVLDNISFDVAEGEFCILVGPSGCGKSTILRLIAGLEQKDSGEIYIGDTEVGNLTPKERDIAMVFQSYALYPHMNVYDNMAFSLRMRKLPRKETDRKVRDAARLLEIENLLDRRPKELSGGQRQRVAIGRAIVRKPRLFLFDEPLSNLDAKLRAAMRVELAGLHRKLGSTMIYVTHDQIEAMTLGEKIILLDKGRIQQIGMPNDVYERPSNLFVASFIGSPQINLITGVIRQEGGNLIFSSGPLHLNVGGRKKLEQYEGKEIVMGIRPESLIPGEGPIRAGIDFVEQLGAETILYTSIGDLKITARIHPDFGKKPGDEIYFSLQERGVHFFHEEKRIETGT